MVRKIFKTGNSLVISLPKESIQILGLREGSEVNMTVDKDAGMVIMKPVKPLAVIDKAFAQQLNDFIEQYRPALETLAE